MVGVGVRIRGLLIASWERGEGRRGGGGSWTMRSGVGVIRIVTQAKLGRWVDRLMIRGSVCWIVVWVESIRKYSTLCRPNSPDS